MANKSGFRSDPRKILPPKAYALRTPHSSVVEYVEPVSAALSGSDPALRGMSPFQLQVEIPIVFRRTTTVKRRGDIFEASMVGADWSRSAVEIPTLSGDLSGQTVEQYLVGGQSVQGSAKSEPTGRIGNPSYADLYTALDVSIQLNQIQQTPPLTLLINPESFSREFTKVQTFGEISKFGYIYHAWGENQPRLNFTAKCGAFVSASRGVQYLSKNDSAAWQNFQSLMTLYRNNGYILDTLGKSYAHHFIGGVSIAYDGWSYYGHLESVSWTLDETNTHGGVQFQIEFTASIITPPAQAQTVSPISPTSKSVLRSPSEKPDTPLQQGQDYGPSVAQVTVGDSSSPGRGVSGFRREVPSPVATVPSFVATPFRRL